MLLDARTKANAAAPKLATHVRRATDGWRHRGCTANNEYEQSQGTQAKLAEEYTQSNDQAASNPKPTLAQAQTTRSTPAPEPGNKRPATVSAADTKRANGSAMKNAESTVYHQPILSKRFVSSIRSARGNAGTKHRAYA